MLCPGHIQVRVGRFVYLVIEFRAIGKLADEVELSHSNKVPANGFTLVIRKTLLAQVADAGGLFISLAFIFGVYKP